MASIRRRGATWQVQVRRQGLRPLVRSFRLKADAELWARQREAEIDRGDLPRDHRTLRFVALASLLERYRDTVTPQKRGAPQERYKLTILLGHPIAQQSLEKLSAADIAAYRDERLAKVTAGTVRRGGFSLWYGLKIGGFLAVPAEAQTTATPAPDKGASPSVTITNPQGSNIVVGPTGGPVTQTIINPDLQKAPQRMLTEKQKAAISNALAEAPPATLFVPYNNSKEALNYSSQFRQIFHARGWIFSDFSGSDLRPKPFDKIRIGWREKKSSSYLAVIKGLTDAQIEFAEGEFTLNDLGTNRALDPSKDIVAFDVGVIPMTDLQIAIDRDQ